MNRRGLIASTKLRELDLVKVIASDLIAQWRRRFFDLGRLASTSACINAHTILKLAEGHPTLATAGYPPLADTASYSGVGEKAFFCGKVSKGRLDLLWRLNAAPGYLASEDALRTYRVVVNGVEKAEQYGGEEVDIPLMPPRDSVAHTASRACALAADAALAVADTLIARGGTPTVVVLASSTKGWLLVPDDVIHIDRKGL